MPFPSTSSRPLLLLLLLLAIERTMSRLKGRTPCAIVYQKQLEWYAPCCTHDNAAALVAATLAATSLRRDVTLHISFIPRTFLTLKLSPVPHLVITANTQNSLLPLSLGPSRPQPCSLCVMFP